ncbi:MAG: hypothetical protein JOZ39_05545 [Chloroflexi bacterium]|nr:hypothetical protein [Chloroflexota bacterium]
MASPERSELNRRRLDSLPPTGVAAVADIQAIFLTRLRRLLERRHGSAGAALDDRQRRMLDRAIYSTFCDCLDLDASGQARALLNRTRDS